MEKDRNTILVTWDYTELSEYALMHAIRIARMVENNVRIIHIIEPNVAKKAITRLKNASERLLRKYKRNITSRWKQ